MEPEGSLPHSQAPATCPLTQNNPSHAPHPTQDQFKYYPPIYA